METRNFQKDVSHLFYGMSETLSMAIANKRVSDPIQRKFGKETDIEALTGIPRRTLQKWRLFGTGPNWYRVNGRVFYDLAEVERWLKSHPVEGAA